MHNLQGIFFMHRILILSFLSLLANEASTQQVFLKLVQPAKNSSTVSTARQYITGTTCKGCSVTLQDSALTVWPTGAFAAAITLRPGDTTVRVVATDAKGSKSTQTLVYRYQLPEPEREVTGTTVAYWRHEPAGDLQVRAGDRIAMTLKTRPGSTVQLANGWQMLEQPPASTGGIGGIYKGEYVVQPGDALFTATPAPLTATILLDDGQELQATSRSKYALFPAETVVLQTKGRLPYLLTGLGEDRLGGTKIGYLDSLVRLSATGKVGNKYRVQLTPTQQAWIEEEHVQILPPGSTTPGSITGNMRVWGDSTYDYVSLAVGQRLPYSSRQELQPTRIVVDVYGATSNTNWIIQQSSYRNIQNVYCRQAADGMLQLQIDLTDQQHWGYRIYYSGSNLIVRVKRRPPVLQLNKLVIGVDAGHGGSNTGAAGITGVLEKNMALLLAQELQQQLQKAGASVIMTRTTDTTYNNHDRYVFFRDRDPDLLLSVHLNSSTDPIHSKGIGMFYRHPGFRSLAGTLLQHITNGAGLPEYALVGGFNFILNGFTEFPNALIETLFVSNPEEEAKVLDAAFRKQLAAAVVKGLQQWLAQH